MNIRPCLSLYLREFQALVALSSAFLLVSPALGAVESEEQAFEAAENLFVSASELSGTLIEEERDKYLKERGWELGLSRANPNGAYIGWGKADISVDALDLKFGQARVLAFEKAFADAKGNFVRSRSATTTTEVVREFIQNEGIVDEEDFLDSETRLKTIYDRLVTLTEAELDAKLEEVGIDPGPLKAQSLRIKKERARDAIDRISKTKALQSVAGLRVQQTFEDLKSIGVLVVYSDSFREWANAAIYGHTVAKLTEGNPTESILEQIRSTTPNGPDDYITSHGVRVMRDSAGNRAFISFGQWSPAITKLDSSLKRNIAIKAAQETSRTLAEANLADFINSTVVLESSASIEEVSKITEYVDSRGSEIAERMQIGEALSTLVKQRSSISLEGVTTLDNWTANHPESGHLIVGHILMWSPASRDAVLHGLNREPGLGGNKTAGAALRNKLRKGPEFPDDF